MPARKKRQGPEVRSEVESRRSKAASRKSKRGSRWSGHVPTSLGIRHSSFGFRHFKKRGSLTSKNTLENGSGQGQVNHDRKLRQRPHGPANISHSGKRVMFRSLSTQRAKTVECACRALENLNIAKIAGFFAVF